MFVLQQDILKRHAIIDDDIFASEVSLGEVAAIIPTVNQHIVPVTINFNVRFVYQFPLSHSIPPVNKRFIKNRTAIENY
jgi:hypothetical protein